MYRRLWLFLCGLVLLLSVASCITDQFDLRKDVDLQVNFSSDGLTLPTESSVEIPLSQIIELKEGGHLTTDEQGNYLFYKDGNDLDTCVITIGHGSLCNATDDTLTYRFFDNPDVQFKDNTRFPSYATMTYAVTVKPEFHPDRPNAGSREFMYMVSELNIDVDVEFEGLNGIPYIDEIHYQVPGFYDLIDPSELTEKNVSTSGLHRHTIRVKGVDFKTANLHEGDVIGLNAETGQLLIEGTVKVEGKVKTVNKSDFANSDDPKMFVHVMVGSLTTTQVTGRFHKSEDVNLSSIHFDDLPDFLHDDEVVVDVENPVVRLTLDNGVPARVGLNAVMKGIRDSREISQLKVGADYGTDDIIFAAGAGDTTFTSSSVWISRIPTEVPDSVHSNVLVPEMLDLIEQIPDKVDIRAYAQTDSSQVVTVVLAKEYYAVPHYELVVPLKLGPTMSIVYRKEIEGLQERLEDVTVSELFFSADVTNRIPLALSFEMTPLDSNGRELEGIEMELPDGIPALGTCSLAVRFANKSGSSDLSRLDRLAIKAYAKSNEQMVGQYLNVNQNLRMDHVRITLKGGKEE